MATKTFKVALSLDNPRIIQSGIDVRSFDKQSIKIEIELTKNSQTYQIPTGAQIKISLLKLARQEQKIILDVPFTSAEAIEWLVPDYLDGYQGEVRVGVYLIVGTENIDVGYFNISSKVSDIDKAAEEFTESVMQGWDQIEADLAEIRATITQVNTLASDFTADVATKQSDVTSKYNAFDTSVTQAGQTIDDILALQTQFQSVLDETTGKDVISAPEIILARGGAQSLGERLDSEKAEVNAQLAQNEGEISRLSGSKADKTELQTGLNTKVSRDENESISWQMIDQDFKNRTLGLTPSTQLGPHSVNTTHLANNSVISMKRTVFGEWGSLIPLPNTPLPDLILKAGTRKLVINGAFNVVYRNLRVRFDELDINLIDGSVQQRLMFNTETNTFRFLTLTDVGLIDEHEILLFIINIDGLYYLKQMSCMFDYTVNGRKLTLSESDYNDKVDPLTFALIFLNNSEREPFFDFNEGVIQIPKPFWVHAKKERYSVNHLTHPEDPEKIEIEMPSATHFFVYFNTENLTFKTYSSAEVMNMTDTFNNRLIAYVEGQNVTMLGRYSTSLVPEVSLGSKDYAYDLSMESLGSYYQANNDNGYDLFDYDTTTAEQFQSELSALANTHSDYIEEINCGVDSSGDYNIYRYKLKPESVEVSNLNKRPAKISLVAGLHAGTEKVSIFSTYYFMKELAENWTDSEGLEYLRHNVEFDIIVNVNPWGFRYAPSGYEDGDYRRNFNGVDLNRNFGYEHRVIAQGSNTYGGEEPFSEKEAQYIRDLIEENKHGLAFIDYHTNGSSGSDYNSLMWNVLNDEPFNSVNIDIAAKYTIQQATRNFIKDYSQPTDVGLFGYLTKNTLSGTATAYAGSVGLPAVTLECFKKFPTDPKTDENGPKAIRAGVEYLGNYIINLIKQYQLNNIREL